MKKVSFSASTHPLSGFVFLLLLLGGCSSTPWPERIGIRTLPTDMEPLDYYNWTNNAASPDDLAAELERLQQDGGRADSPTEIVQTVQKTILLTLVDSEHGNDAEAAVLLANLSNACPDSGILLRNGLGRCKRYQEFARVLRIILQERSALRDALDDNARAESEIQQLKEQIEALTSIEQQLIERESPRIQ
ncbi:MAG: hypothetical protein RQ757_12410 [Pseudomonadales bacterium]|nr:hypothetical protein [Pseudomonadales bacterium]